MGVIILTMNEILRIRTEMKEEQDLTIQKRLVVRLELK
jgi:hypothetical protein